MSHNFSDETINTHLKEDHGLNTVSTYVQELVYGGVDGIVTTFAVVAGFTGASQMATGPSLPALTVLLFGLANLFADASSMGLGNLLSVRSAQKVRLHHRNIEMSQLESDKHFEKKETEYLLQQKGFAPEEAKQITDLMAENKDYWLEFMMMYELDMPFQDDENPLLTGFATFASFIIFGIIPLSPYFFLPPTVTTFYTSIAATTIALILLGILRWRVTNEKLALSLIEVMLIGGVSASVAYFVGTLFG